VRAGRCKPQGRHEGWRHRSTGWKARTAEVVETTRAEERDAWLRLDEGRQWRHCRPGPTRRKYDGGANFEIPREEVSTQRSRRAQAVRHRDWVSVNGTKVSRRTERWVQAASTARAWRHATAVKVRQHERRTPRRGLSRKNHRSKPMADEDAPDRRRRADPLCTSPESAERSVKTTTAARGGVSEN
jgi:hypothetical protein